ncbi:MAG TPA: hypothetical protein VHA75_03145 [Rugosimonospora sp.]|nr:hypothetical protein [Rugosimonospora sp.]
MPKSCARDTAGTELVPRLCGILPANEANPPAPATGEAPAVGEAPRTASRTSTLRPSAPIGWRLGPPLAAYLLGQLVCAVAAARHGYDWFSTGSRIRWDGGIYLDIARTGYYAAPCGQINPGLNDPAAICGNAGWFPLLPLLVLLLSGVAGMSLAHAGVLLVEACAFGTLVLVWYLLEGVPTRRALGCLAVAALLPGSVYYHATFPMSLCVLLALASFALLRRGNRVAAGFAGAAAALAYPLGVLVAPAAVGYLLIAPGRPARRRLATAALVGGLGGAGTLVFFLFLWARTGRFWAYLEIQARYPEQGHDPLRTLLVWLARPEPAVSLEMLFSAGLVGLAVLAVGRAARRGRATTLDWALAAVYGPLVFLAPLVVGTNQSEYRAHTLLLPLVLVLRHLRTPVLAALATAGAQLAFALTSLFLDRTLV